MLSNMDYLIQFLVELIGTFIFLTVIISTGNPLAIGLTLIALIYFALYISGGFFNPAVTVMFYANKTIDSTQFILFIIAQFAGGLLAYYFYNNYLKEKINKD